jgi:hypothetical protein
LACSPVKLAGFTPWGMNYRLDNPATTGVRCTPCSSKSIYRIQFFDAVP